MGEIKVRGGMMKAYILLVVLLTCALYLHAGSKEEGKRKYTCGKDEEGQEHCHKNEGFEEEDDDDDDDEPAFFDNEPERLFKWDPVEVGHTREIKVTKDQTVTMKTLAKKPAIFEIMNFLTDEESEHIKQQAVKNGLSTSTLYIDSKNREKMLLNYASVSDYLNNFSILDIDGDDVITLEELRDVAIEYRLYLKDQDIETMLKVLDVPELKDGNITREEFENVDMKMFDAYFEDLREND